jgi:NTP pyrophosphatase (non-canonical NTP hydrolase)
MKRELSAELVRVAFRALSFHGEHEQKKQCQEECAELITAINHHRRGKIRVNKLAKEVADVMIMAEQMCLIVESMGCDFDAVFQKTLAEVVEKLERNEQ